MTKASPMKHAAGTTEDLEVGALVALELEALLALVARQRDDLLRPEREVVAWLWTNNNEELI